jgi:vesicle-fusing ATPase
MEALYQEGSKPSNFGMFYKDISHIKYKLLPNEFLQLDRNESESSANAVFRSFNFTDLGIGGLDKEFSNIFRRAFASRTFPPKEVKELGLQHVKGILLYGPPGLFCLVISIVI